MNISAIGSRQTIPQNINSQKPNFKAKLDMDKMPELRFDRLCSRNENTNSMYLLQLAIERLKALPEDLVIKGEKYKNCDYYKFTNPKNGLTHENMDRLYTTNEFLDTFISMMVPKAEADAITSQEAFFNLDTDGGKIKSCVDIIEKNKKDIFA